MSDKPPRLPLAGVRVLELGMFIAGPYAGQQLADLGAEVIKVEHPRIPDPMRTWRDFGDGDLWWPSLSRNKRHIAVDLSSEKGAEVILRLARESHVVLENFQPGTLEKWGLGPDRLLEENPAVIVVRISGFGQDGPYAGRPGFGSVGEAMGGIRHLTGWPDRPSTRSGVSLGDQVCALFATVGALAALRHADLTGQGQVIDAAIYESVLALTESTVAEYVRAGVSRNRSGPTLPGVAPSNVYPTADGSEVLIAANSDAIYRRLIDALSIPELTDDARFSTHTDRATNMEELDALLSVATSQHDARALVSLLSDAQVPASLIYAAPDLISDVHIRSREMIQNHDVPGVGPLPMIAPVPRFSRTPTTVRWVAQPHGSETNAVLWEVCGIGPDEVEALVADGVIAVGQGPHANATEWK